MTDTEITARVAKGAALLDRVCPDWPSRINLSQLVLTDPWQCVIGQRYGSFFRVYDLIPAGVKASAYGFDLEQGCTSVGWRMLEDAWVDVLADRVVREPVTAGVQ